LLLLTAKPSTLYTGRNFNVAEVYYESGGLRAKKCLPNQEGGKHFHIQPGNLFTDLQAELSMDKPA
jgi:hypothetical protein